MTILNIDTEIMNLHDELSEHPVYKELNNTIKLKAFMETHVYAVWDFMSLLKNLQRELTCVQVPWRPSKYSKNIVRMINEIVLGEESDVDYNGIAMDHFTMYLDGMKEVGADTDPINKLIEEIEFNKLPSQVDKLPSHIKDFVSFNLNLAIEGDTVAVLASFFYGREHLIPDMFTGILNVLNDQGSPCPAFKYYLERHIELDGGEHSELAEKCLMELCDGDELELIRAKKVGLESLKLRIKLWDGVHAQYQKMRVTSAETS